MNLEVGAVCAVYTVCLYQLSFMAVTSHHMTRWCSAPPIHA